MNVRVIGKGNLDQGGILFLQSTMPMVLFTAQAIGKYERNEDISSSGVLIALAKALGVSIGYLMDTQGVVLTGVEFRTKASTTASDRANVETEVLEWIERYIQIEHVLELESSAWQCPIVPPRHLQAPADAEALAAEVREVWSLGIDPIPNMTELLESKSLKVLIVSLPERVGNSHSRATSEPPQAEWIRDTFCDTLVLGDLRSYKDLGSHRGLVSC